MKLLQKIKYSSIMLMTTLSLAACSSSSSAPSASSPSTPSSPSGVANSNGLSYEDFYSAISSGAGQEILDSTDGKFYQSGLNELFSWGMQLLQFAYVLAVAIVFIALVINITRLIIGGDNSKKVEAARHDIMINMIGLGMCGSIGAIYVIVLTLINLFH